MWLDAREEPDVGDALAGLSPGFPAQPLARDAERALMRGFAASWRLIGQIATADRWGVFVILDLTLVSTRLARLA